MQLPNSETEPKRLLYVEDDPAMSRILAHIMRRSHPEWKLSHAANMIEGLKAIHHEVPHVVITDLRMPRSSISFTKKHATGGYKESDDVVLPSEAEKKMYNPHGDLHGMHIRSIIRSQGLEIPWIWYSSKYDSKLLPQALSDGLLYAVSKGSDSIYKIMEIIEHALQRQEPATGVIRLIAGPTGSGKSEMASAAELCTYGGPQLVSRLQEYNGNHILMRYSTRQPRNEHGKNDTIYSPQLNSIQATLKDLARDQALGLWSNWGEIYMTPLLEEALPYINRELNLRGLKELPYYPSAEQLLRERKDPWITCASLEGALGIRDAAHRNNMPIHEVRLDVHSPEEALRRVTMKYSLDTGSVDELATHAALLLDGEMPSYRKETVIKDIAKNYDDPLLMQGGQLTSLGRRLSNLNYTSFRKYKEAQEIFTDDYFGAKLKLFGTIQEQRRSEVLACQSR